mmetsp:Transcript_22135/g.35651  ORF Transcript_22135/g.35651 Transcript_22135/m.35651 type:complete len:212 (-) Transcript_22135:1976-2611(-)
MSDVWRVGSGDTNEETENVPRVAGIHLPCQLSNSRKKVSLPLQTLTKQQCNRQPTRAFSLRNIQEAKPKPKTVRRGTNEVEIKMTNIRKMTAIHETGDTAITAVDEGVITTRAAAMIPVLTKLTTASRRARTVMRSNEGKTGVTLPTAVMARITRRRGMIENGIINRQKRRSTDVKGKRLQSERKRNINVLNLGMTDGRTKKKPLRGYWHE